MSSCQNTALPEGSLASSASTKRGVKRERDHEDDDVDPAPTRKKVTIPPKPCIVCTDDVPKNRFPKLPHKQDENNKRSSDVCFKCFRDHLRVEVENKGHEAVSCPQCSKLLDEHEVRKLASSQTYQECVTPDHSHSKRKGLVADQVTRYLDKAARKCMQEEEEFHACPNAGCPWGMYYGITVVCECYTDWD